MQRWSDRFTIDGTWENNLYNFYLTVINKLTSNVKVPFKIQGTLKIIKTKDSLEFTNPGNLKIDLESLFKGGNSKSRNPRIQKLFSLIGLGEGTGSGFPKILAAWNEQSWRTPGLKEETNLSQVSLELWMISMLLEECLE